MPIDSAQLMEECETVKFVQNLNLREQPGIFIKLPPTISNLSTEFHKQYTIDSVQQIYGNETRKKFKFLSRGDTGVFPKVHLLNNFLTGQPIITSNILIDLARQAEDDENLERSN
jgi:hypothetical protein